MNGIEKRVAKQIGQEIKEKRIMLGFDQQQLAKHCRLQKPQIEKIENGENYTVKTLINVMQTLGLNFRSFSNVNFYKDDNDK